MPAEPSNPLRVLVVTGDHSEPDPTKWDGGYSSDDLDLHKQMCAALESLDGYRFEVLSEHRRLLDRLQNEPPDLVLNFCDTGFRNVPSQELHVAALYEMFGVPYTGAAPASMVLCYDKAIVRLIAEAHGVPTPREVYVPADQPLSEVSATYPCLVKPAQGDGSVGINRTAVVGSDEEARAQLEWFRRELPGRAALLQEYLPGPEYGLALIGNPDGGLEAFPPLRVDFGELPEGLPHILAFETKTGPETPYGSVRIVEADLSDEDLVNMRARASLMFERLQCRDYARFDFRTGADGEIKLIEVNPNPAWSSAGKLALMAGFAQKTYSQMLEMILESARRRLNARSEGD